MTIDSTTGAAAVAATPLVDTKKSDILGKDAFLSLLMTQMKNQDPSKPVDNTAMIAQLAQFSSLEQLQQVNTTLSSIAGYFQQMQAAADAAITTPATTDSSTTTQRTN
jgi:flagellar basal-body rod modification protein FlgD